MTDAKLLLGSIVDWLATVYGEPAAPPHRTLFELLLLENVAYLVDDARREAAFGDLVRRVGTRPEDILAATPETLAGVAARGILADNQSDKLRRIARLALDEFAGNLESIRDLPLTQARRALMRFPSIGEPGAEKILLFGRSHAVLGLESNGVRVLTRLGVVADAGSYARTYRGVQAYVAPFSGNGFDWLIRAHQLLRQHGQEICRRSTPLCEQCPLSDVCAFANQRRSA